MTDLAKELFNLGVAMNKVMQTQYQAQHDADVWRDDCKRLEAENQRLNKCLDDSNEENNRLSVDCVIVGKENKQLKDQLRCHQDPDTYISEYEVMAIEIPRLKELLDKCYRGLLLSPSDHAEIKVARPQEVAK